jgi:ATP-dependent exoDNAse (exonuclease V) alpha subunit
MIALDAIAATSEFDAAKAAFLAGRGVLFVTGRAGTGKSTLLRSLRQINQGKQTRRNLAVLAPTGLAAINVQGQTLHSFFRLPPRLIDVRGLKPGANAKLIRALDCLIIDEVSMVRADLMDAVDRALRLGRERPREPFGGCQVILFGDPHQLSPVCQREMMPFFEEKYGGVHFFSAPVFAEAEGDMLELTQVFRQTDADFVGLLNAAREGCLGREHYEMLNSRLLPADEAERDHDAVILTTTNQMAQDVNVRALDRLRGKLASIEATVTGRFEESAYPTDKVLALKVGAKVMMVRNDPKGRWVNGTLGTIAAIRKEEVSVEINGEVHEIEPVSWENTRYSAGEENSEIEATSAGKFKQLPLRLAWAMTIHKAQGLTLPRLHLDLGRGSFAHGQTYVALSRCRSLEGLSLARAIRPRDLFCLQAALDYRRRFQPLAVEAE